MAFDCRCLILFFFRILPVTQYRLTQKVTDTKQREREKEKERERERERERGGVDYKKSAKEIYLK